MVQTSGFKGENETFSEAVILLLYDISRHFHLLIQITKLLKQSQIEKLLYVIPTM